MGSFEEVQDQVEIQFLQARIPEWEADRETSRNVTLGSLAVAAGDGLALAFNPNSPVLGGIFLAATVVAGTVGVRWAIASDTVNQYKVRVNNLIRSS